MVTYTHVVGKLYEHTLQDGWWDSSDSQQKQNVNEKKHSNQKEQVPFLDSLEKRFGSQPDAFMYSCILCIVDNKHTLILCLVWVTLMFVSM